MTHSSLLPQWWLLAVLLFTACTSSTVPPSVVQGSVRLAPGTSTGSSATCDTTHTASCGNSQCCGTGDSCVISVTTTSGGFFCATCPSDFPAACSRTTCCRTAAACDTNFRNSTFGSCLCGTGETLCGDTCCPVGTVCEGGVCLGCPASAPNLCGDECSSDACPDPGGGECPTDTRACPGGTSCCPSGTRCCEGGGCCPPSTPYLGGGRCYSSLADCQSAGNNRCASCQG